MSKFILSILLLLPICLFSQKNIESISSNELISKAVELYEEEDYMEAIKLFDKVSVNDTNYSVAQYEKALAYYRMEEYADVISVTEDLLSLDLYYAKKDYFYSLIGSSFDELGDLDKSIEVFNLGINKYPKSYLLRYNRAIVYSKMNKHKEAIEDYKKTIQFYAGHKSSHYQLALYALNEGRYTEAMLGFTTYLLLDPTSTRSNEVLQIMENISNGEYEEDPKGFNWDEKEDYEELNIFFKNKVALEKKYKVNLTIDVAFGKQLHFLLSNLEYNKDNEGFWNQTYVSYLKEIFNDSKIDDLTLYCLQSSGSSKTQSKLKSKKSKIEDFISVAKEKWGNYVNYKYVDFEGEFQKVYIGYSNNGAISSMGLVENDKAVGKWYYYYPNGALKMEGVFSDEGKRNGHWIVYNEINGNISNDIIFKDGDRNGEALSYFESGDLYKRMTNRENELQDILYIYFQSGDVKEKIKYKDGERDGLVETFHENGRLNYTYFYKDGKPSGKYKSYYPNKQLAYEFTLLDGLYDGLYTSYYENGAKKLEVNYIKDKKDGEYKEWYENGELKDESIYKEGVSVNDFKIYYSNGVLNNKGAFDEDGKQSGVSIEYDYDGKKFFEREFKKGELISVKNFNKSGEIIYSDSKKGKKLEFKKYYPSGVLKSEGLFVNDERVGDWKYYSTYGNISAIEKYEAGKITDTAKYFYNNGQLKSLEVYEDGELNGINLKYNIFGELIREGNFKDGEWDKDFYDYDNAGNLKSEYYLVDGEINGILKNYGVDGKLTSWKKYENGKEVLSNFLDTNENIIDAYKEFHGEVSLHDFNNKFIRYKATYKNGKSDGVSTWYNPDGKINTKGAFVNGKREGKWFYYNREGGLRKEMSYLNGLLDGEYKVYSSNGVCTYLAVYKNGVAEGEIIDHYPNGKLESKRSYRNDELHGKSTYYNQEGDVYIIQYYDNGTLKSYSYLDKSGNEVEPVEIKLGDNQIITYFENGNKACEFSFNNGLIEGEYIVYYKNGKISRNKEYKFGRLHGESVFYFPNGNVKKKGTFYRGDYNGDYSHYYSNGTLKKVSNYVQDELHGEVKTYDDNGLLIKTYIYKNDELVEIK